MITTGAPVCFHLFEKSRLSSHHRNWLIRPILDRLEPVGYRIMKYLILVSVLHMIGCSTSHHSSSSVMEATDLVYASLVLKAPSGKSVLDTTATQANIHELTPDTQTIQKARKFLTDNGFLPGPEGVVLSFSGERRLIEQVFHISLTPYEKEGKRYYRKSGRVIVPEAMRNLIADVVLDDPRQFFSP